MLDRLPGLKLIAVARGGPVNIDMKAARARNIRVVNTPGPQRQRRWPNSPSARSCRRRASSRAATTRSRAGEWRGDLYRADVTGDELSDMTVGVIGYGDIGTRVVQLLKAFGCRILVCDPYVAARARGSRRRRAQVSLERLLAESDVVTLHARVTPETTGFIAARELRAHEGGRLLHQHRPRPHGRLRCAL